MAQVLLVCRDGAIGGDVADAICDAGHELMWCPGPRGLDNSCRAAKAGVCPLTTGTDVVVVDAWLASDQFRQGFTSWHLLMYYRKLEMPVVVLTAGEQPPRSLLDGNVAVVPRRSDPACVTAAIDAFLTRSTSGRRKTLRCNVA